MRKVLHIMEQGATYYGARLPCPKSKVLHYFMCYALCVQNGKRIIRGALRLVARCMAGSLQQAKQCNDHDIRSARMTNCNDRDSDKGGIVAVPMQRS